MAYGAYKIYKEIQIENQKVKEKDEKDSKLEFFPENLKITPE